MSHTEESSIPFLADDREKNGDRPELRVHEAPFLKQKTILQYRWLALCVAVILVTNTTTFFLTRYNQNHHLDKTCALHTSQSWTPVLGSVDITYTSTKFNGSFFKETIYRKEASPEVDAAWLALGVDYKPMVIPVEEVERSGISPDRLKVGEKNGGPGYPVIVEALHQLHCLNLLRQSIHFNYNYYRNLGKGAFANNEDSLKLHIGHCLDTLRQTLMCTADTGLQPFLWVGDPPHPFPDFNREHKCRNFDAIREFAERRQEMLLVDMDVVPHEGALILAEVP
ncbi:hypothetical protein B7463_g3987, partial [Scytalidium lignicola]